MASEEICEIGFVSRRSLFLTLPTRGLTGPAGHLLLWAGRAGSVPTKDNRDRRGRAFRCARRRDTALGHDHIDAAKAGSRS
jgi:hypothetical protein